MTKRKTLSRLARVRIFDAHNGVCHLCNTKIHVSEKWESSHIKSLWEGGADTEDNLAPAHVTCHRQHTNEEAPVKAKTDRIRANFIGVPKKSRWNKPWRKFNGEIVYPDRPEVE